MNSVPNTVLRRAARFASLPIFLFVVAFLPFVTASSAAASSDDMVVIGAASVLDDADLSANRGGTVTITTTTVTSNQTLESTSTGNTMNVGGNLTNGPISVGDGFGGSGFGSYVMNTGNNSVINSGVSLSVLTLD